ncbi:MAG TPA: serine protease [Candidatus Solibacter sp.]|nr:serine protease [Candidatus Solibacter sp.]
MDFLFQDADPSHPGMQFAMQLIADHKGSHRCLGTAFSVAPGLAITAAHVVNEYVLTEEQPKQNVVPSLIAIQIFEGKVLQWLVDAIYGSAACDVAFLRFLRPTWWGTGPGQVNPRCARLNFNPPAVGDELRLFGFPQSSVVEGTLYSSPCECICRVERVDLKTDLPLKFRPLSHIDVVGRLLDGMSGGPCFDREWNVIGVNSKGWEGLDLAHVALLWPAMKTPIDLFKAGEFPAMDLFKDGPAKAVGYRRLVVTSKGEARLANVDPDGLVPLKFSWAADQLSSALNFAASNAQEALVELRGILERTINGGEGVDRNAILRLARHYFWEIEAALLTALSLAARQVGISAPEHPAWEQLIAEWKNKALEPTILDELSTLDFSWNGVDLFELRAYADLCRSGVLMTSATISVATGQVFGVSLGPVCRKGGQQIFLPDGLDRFIESARRFVQRLLWLSARSGQMAAKLSA